MTSARFIALLVVVGLIAVLPTIGSGGWWCSRRRYTRRDTRRALAMAWRRCFRRSRTPGVRPRGHGGMVGHHERTGLTAAIMTYEMTLTTLSYCRSWLVSPSRTP